MCILFVCGGLVVLAYFFVDRPVAYFVQQHHLDTYGFLKWMTYTPILCEAIAPIVLVAALIVMAWHPLTRWQRTLLAISVNLLLTIALKDHLKYLFGRYWPGTWINDNPSFLQNGAYGFHPFHGGAAYASFPSGHTARICAVVSVIWIAYPRWRWLCLLLAVSVMIGLVGMNYHFVGDVIAGGGLGMITGLYVTHFFQLDKKSSL